MSITTTSPRDDAQADPWQQWQRGNAKNNRRAAVQARIGFAFVLTAAFAWLGLQLFSSPAWR